MSAEPAVDPASAANASASFEPPANARFRPVREEQWFMILTLAATVVAMVATALITQPELETSDWLRHAPLVIILAIANAWQPSSQQGYKTPAPWPSTAVVALPATARRYGVLMAAGIAAFFFIGALLLRGTPGFIPAYVCVVSGTTIGIAIGRERLRRRERSLGVTLHHMAYKGMPRGRGVPLSYGRPDDQQAQQA